MRLLTAATLLATLALACTSNAPAIPSPSPTPTPEVTATPSPTLSPKSAPPAHTPTPSPTPVDRTRSLETVDLVIAAVEARDIDALEALIHYTPVPCDGENRREGPPYPPCNGEPFATPVESFPASICHAVWHRNPRPMIERFVADAGPLVAVIEGPDQTVDYGVPYTLERSAGDYQVIFTAERNGLTVAYEAVVENRGLVSLRMGCNTPRDALLPRVTPTPSVIRRGQGFDAAQPPPEPTPLPDLTMAPRSSRTGLAGVDAVLAAMESHDPGQIDPLLRQTSSPCTHAPDIGSVVCNDDELEMTVVEAFLHTSCEGWWSRDGLSGIAEELAAWDVPLFAVAATSYRAWYQVLYTDGPTDELGGRVLYVEDGRIVGIGGGCSTPEQWASWHHIILRGPAWPQDDAP